MIFNGESINELIGNVKYINHVHISEPYLKPIEERGLHNELKNILLSEGYRGYISIEMSTIDDLNILDKKLQYINHIYL